MLILFSFTPAKPANLSVIHSVISAIEGSEFDGTFSFVSCVAFERVETSLEVFDNNSAKYEEGLIHMKTAN